MLEGMGNNLSWKKKDDFVEKLISEGYKKFANYGRNLLEPIFWLLRISLLSYFVNFVISFDNNYSANSINNKSITLNKELSISYNDNSYNINSDY